MLTAAGFLAADEEAHELLAASSGDRTLLSTLLARRVDGEPLAWIVGHAPFAGLDIRINTGTYVPRWQSLELTWRATAALPDGGAAVDLCTGSGAIARVLSSARPRARVVGTDIDAASVANARSNSVETYHGDLFAPLPGDLKGSLHVVVAVVPYVPTDALRLLPRDTLTHEDVAHYDGGTDGTDLLLRVVAGAPEYLRPGGQLILELGGDQGEAVRSSLEGNGYHAIETWTDDDGDVRGIQAVFG